MCVCADPLIVKEVFLQSLRTAHRSPCHHCPCTCCTGSSPCENPTSPDTPSRSLERELEGGRENLSWSQKEIS